MLLLCIQWHVVLTSVYFCDPHQSVMWWDVTWRPRSDVPVPPHLLIVCSNNPSNQPPHCQNQTNLYFSLLLIINRSQAMSISRLIPTGSVMYCYGYSMWTAEETALGSGIVWTAFWILLLYSRSYQFPVPMFLLHWNGQMYTLLC